MTRIKNFRERFRALRRKPETSSSLAGEPKKSAKGVAAAGVADGRPAASGRGPDESRSAEILGALEDAGLRIGADFSRQQIAIAVRMAMASAKVQGAGSSLEAITKEMTQSELSAAIEAETDPEKMEYLYDQYAAKYMRTIGKAKPPPGESFMSEKELSDRIESERDPEKVYELYREYSRRFLPSLR